MAPRSPPWVQVAHPDIVGPRATPLAIILNACYSTLMDDVLRAVYDEDLRHFLRDGVGRFDGRPVSGWMGRPGETRAVFVAENVGVLQRAWCAVSPWGLWLAVKPISQEHGCAVSPAGPGCLHSRPFTSKSASFSHVFSLPYTETAASRYSFPSILSPPSPPHRSALAAGPARALLPPPSSLRRSMGAPACSTSGERLALQCMQANAPGCAIACANGSMAV